jgi:hypothetical protein
LHPVMCRFVIVSAYKPLLKIFLTADLSSPYNGNAEFSIRRRDGISLPRTSIRSYRNRREGIARLNQI